MARPADPSPLLIPLDPSRPEPLHRQLYRGIRDAILSGRIPAGSRLPSTRSLATDLDVSRSTVLTAFDQLVAEGYVVGAVGSGSYAAFPMPDRLLRVPPPDPPWAELPVRLAARMSALPRRAQRPGARYPGPFWTGVPPVDVFPLALWARLTARCTRSLAVSSLYHGAPAGHGPLREAVASHLAASRGVQCVPEQVVMVSSAQAALELACRALLEPGDPAWLEDPAWSGARWALIAAGARIIHVPVDGEGLAVEAGIAQAPGARLAFVSPSHQHPLGVTMSLDRRLALLDWAARTGAWILEDDYDSEYRYAGRPLTALQGLDSAGRVLYVGTFNKTLFPALRVAYIVVPRSLIRAFTGLRAAGGQHVAAVSQLVLTEFIAGGHYARYLRRIRAVCRERRDALIGAVGRHAGGALSIPATETGLHVVAYLASGRDDRAASAAAAERGIEAAPLSEYHAGPCPRPGLVLGFGGLRPPEIEAATGRLAEALAGLPG